MGIKLGGCPRERAVGLRGFFSHCPPVNTIPSDDNPFKAALSIMATKNSNDSLHNEELGGKANALHAEVLVDPDLMSDAFMAENREHEMGLWVSW
jgi:hypothetical protein